MAHKLGAFHHLPHGVANAVILTDVMRYNAAEVPTRMGTFSQYQYPHAHFIDFKQTEKSQICDTEKTASGA